jgi:hypothetical protein
MPVTKRAQSFRDGKPKAGLTDPVSTGDELQSNKNMSGGRDLARPLEPGVRAPYMSTGGKRKGRRGKAR